MASKRAILSGFNKNQDKRVMELLSCSSPNRISDGQYVGRQGTYQIVVLVKLSPIKFLPLRKPLVNREALATTFLGCIKVSIALDNTPKTSVIYRELLPLLVKQHFL